MMPSFRLSVGLLVGLSLSTTRFVVVKSYNLSIELELELEFVAGAGKSI